MRYRLLETVRQYAQEKLAESGEANDVRIRHRDYYTATAAAFESRGHPADEQLMAWAQANIDNLRAAFAWSRENSDLEAAAQLLISLRPLSLRGGRALEAMAGLALVLTDEGRSKMASGVWANAVAYRSILAVWVGGATELSHAQEALAIARQLGDQGLIAHTLIACGVLVIYNADMARPYFDEAIDLVSEAGDQWSLCQILSYQSIASMMAGEPTPARATAEQARDLADAIGDRFFSRNSRAWLSSALMMQGELAQATEVARNLAIEADAAADQTMINFGHATLGALLAWQGQGAAARAAAQVCAGGLRSDGLALRRLDLFLVRACCPRRG